MNTSTVMLFPQPSVQGSAKRWSSGLVNFDPATSLLFLPGLACGSAFSRTVYSYCAVTSPAIYRARLKGDPGFGEFVSALAYHFCLALPAEFTQPGDQSPLVGDSFSTREEEV